MNARAIPFSIAAAVFLVDRVTKWMICRSVGAFDIHRLIPGFFNIVHTENPGAAFSLLADASGVWRSVFLIGLSSTVTIFIAIMLWRGSKHGTLESLVRLGLALVLGGALGNLFDRVLTGTVTDFLEVYYGSYYFPAFNVADSAISIGAGLLLIDMLRGRSKKLEPQSLDVP